LEKNRKIKITHHCHYEIKYHLANNN